MRPLTCTKRWSDYPAAHRAPFHTGHCRLVHGHTWSFEAEFIADTPDGNGFVLDFGHPALKAFRAWLGHMFDHTLIIAANDPHRDRFEALERDGLAHVRIVPATCAEAVATFCADHLARMLAEHDDPAARAVRVARFRVYEAPGAWVDAQPSTAASSATTTNAPAEGRA